MAGTANSLQPSCRRVILIRLQTAPQNAQPAASTQPTTAFTTTVATADGPNHSFFRRERPHLLFDKSGTTPIMLFTSLTQWGDPKHPGDAAFTFGQPIKTAADMSSAATLSHFLQ